MTSLLTPSPGRLAPKRGLLAPGHPSKPHGVIRQACSVPCRGLPGPTKDCQGPPRIARAHKKKLKTGQIPVKQFPGRVWGGTGLPKGLLGPLQSIPLAQIPPKPHGGPFPPQNHVFRAPFFAPKRSLAQPEPKSRSGGPKMGPRVKQYQTSVLKKHAESSGRYSKRSHMLQVMAENHPVPSIPKRWGS